MYMCGVPRIVSVYMYMCGVHRDCGCVHVWSAKGLWVCRCVECLGIVGVYMGGLWVCTCVECLGIVGMYMCGVYRDCVWSA